MLFNLDFKDMLLALSVEKIDFLIVGAYAVAAHGHPTIAFVQLGILVLPTVIPTRTKSETISVSSVIYCSKCQTVSANTPWNSRLETVETESQRVHIGTLGDKSTSQTEGMMGTAPLYNDAPSSLRDQSTTAERRDTFCNAGLRHGYLP